MKRIVETNEIGSYTWHAGRPEGKDKWAIERGNKG